MISKNMPHINPEHQEHQEHLEQPQHIQNFIVTIIEKDIQNNKHAQRLDQNNQKLPQVITRFPPEPNGYLHIGHAKSICLNFGLAQRYNGRCHLRFDDTNPEKESDEFVQDIQKTLTWLGFHTQNNKNNYIYYASDYFDILYDYAEKLIEHGYAYVDSQTAEEIKQNRGNLTQVGIDSPYRDANKRSIQENLTMFQDMRAGKYTEGMHVLRAKIDMAHPNMNMRDPVIYRIRYAHHHRTGDKWCIYPMYDYTHCISDALEAITHSICTLEFEDHRPLYDWILNCLYHIGVFDKNTLSSVSSTMQTLETLPKQYEFARLNLYYALTSKRKILQLIQNKVVDGWDDPRLATLAGIRRRGYTPESIRLFCERIGVSKADSWIDYSVLEQCLRDDLDPIAPRVTAVLKPLKLIIDNMPNTHSELCYAPINPHNEDAGKREFSISNTLWIEQDDFMQEASKGFFRLFVGNKVRLRYGFVIECTGYDVDKNNNVIAVHANYYADSKSGTVGSNNYKVKGNIHWVDAKHNLGIQVNLYNHLFTDAQPDSAGKNFLNHINQDSKSSFVAYLEHSGTSKKLQKGDHVQFERHGYFVRDLDDSNNDDDAYVFNRITTLKDSKHKI
jgi:glutaminyl-tRNA synthetase